MACKDREGCLARKVVVACKDRGSCLARQDVVTGKAGKDGFNLSEFFGKAIGRIVVGYWNNSDRLSE